MRISIKCPNCGRWAEVFVRLGDRPGETGTLVSNETCDCGYVFAEGSDKTDYEQ